MSITSQAEADQHPSAAEHIDRLKKLLAEAQNEASRHKQRLDKMGLIVLEREKKISELQHYEYNFRKASEQKHLLNTSEDKLREQIKTLNHDKERLIKELEEHQQRAVQLERVNHFLREKQEEARLEINQLHSEFNKTQNHVVEVSEKLQTSTRSQQDLEEELVRERQAKEEAIEEVTALYSQFESLKKMLADAKNKVDGIQAEKDEIQAAQEKLKQEEIEKAHASRIDAESHLKIAQQHLAKKVKETSDLNDKVYSQDLLIQELQNQLEQAKERILEQQQSFDLQLHQEKRLYEQLNESFRSTESLVTKWEEKYFNVYEKWQENEIQLREMKKIEAKHNQLQVLLANIGGFIGTPMNCAPQMAEMTSSEMEEGPSASISETSETVRESFTEPDLFENKPPVIETSNMKKPYHNLFDMPAQGKRLKDNFFE